MRRPIIFVALALLIGSGASLAVAQEQTGTVEVGTPQAGCVTPMASPGASPDMPLAASPTPPVGSPVASPEASPGALTPCTTPAAGMPVAGTERTINVTASAYKFTPDTFNLKVGQPVTFVVTSTDIFHTFTVKQSKDATENIFNMNIPPRQTIRYTFTPTQPGDLFLYCVPHLGLGMTGTIHVSA